MPQISITDLAKQKLDEYLAEEPSETVVRILVEDDGKYGLSLDEQDQGDLPFSAEGLNFVVEEQHAKVVEGLKIDYLDQGASSGFSLSGGRGSRKAVVVGSAPTPNPAARRFTLAFSTGAAARSYAAPLPADAPLAVREAFELEGVAAVFLRDDFATVTRAEGGPPWEELEPKLEEAFGLLSEDRGAPPEPAEGDDLSARLTRFLEGDVAPFLQRDGGDLELAGVEGGAVSVRLKGACVGCPSQERTLQGAVAARLQAQFDEVESVTLA